MEQKSSFLNEFIVFVQKYGVIGLAIGFITGSAAVAFVKVLSDSLLTPIVSWIINLFGKNAFNSLNVDIGQGIELKFGDVLNGLITFLSVLAFVYLLVKFVINRFMTEDDHKKV